MIQIFVEGESDVAFIKKYLGYLGIVDINDTSILKITATKGVTKLHLLANDFQENTNLNKGINLVIFDADDPAKDFGGYTARCRYLEDRKTADNIDFNYFLFPDHSNDGDFESLLEQIINSKHSCLFDCFRLFKNCVESKKDASGQPLYNTPLRKSKIYAYIDAMKKTKKERERFKNNKDFFFDNSEFWDMTNPILNPLKTFLTSHITACLAARHP